MREDLQRYSVTPQLKEGAAKEITIPKSMGDGKYEL
jgi:hypothetical protein